MKLKEKISTLKSKIKLPSKKSWKILGFIIVGIAGGSLGGIGTTKAIKFFRENTIVIQSPIKINTQKAFEVVTLKEYDRRQRENEIINQGADEIIKRIKEMDQPKVTPDPKDPTITKEEAGISEAIIKPVQAQETIKYTYTAYSNRPHYETVIKGLKIRFTNWEDAAELVAKESGFNPLVKNGIGACGLWQANKCEKMDCKLEDIDCQLDWGKDYISGRYGTVSKALSFWKSRTPINGKDVGNWF